MVIKRMIPATSPTVNNNNNASPFPLRQEATFNEEYYYLPTINLIVLTGLKGATKTCNLVRLGLKSMIQWKRPTFSDFPFAGEILGQYFEVQPMPDDIFVTYGRGLPQFPVVITDELQEFFDRQNWASVESKLGVSAFQQVRKLGLTVIGATQFFHYLNPRLNDQVDILIRCNDMRFTPWGIGEDIKRGREALLEYYDLSGSVRGKTARNPSNPHWISGEPFHEELVFTEPYWRFFDTRRLTAIEHRFRRYAIEKEVVRVDPLGNRGTAQQDLNPAIDSIFGGLREKGKEHIKALELWNMLKADGFDISMKGLGEFMRDTGYEKVRLNNGFNYIV